MGLRDYEDYIMIVCSPIRQIKGTELFLANISLFHEDLGPKLCGIQLPQHHIAYNDGFTDDELKELLEIVREREDELTEMAMNTPLNPDAPEGDIEIIGLE